MVINAHKNSSWVDHRTSTVHVRMLVYNPNHGIYASIDFGFTVSQGRQGDQQQQKHARIMVIRFSLYATPDSPPLPCLPTRSF